MGVNGCWVLMVLSQVSGDVRSKNKRLNDRDYRGMLLHHGSNQKMPMSKSETQPLAQEAP